MPKKEVQPCDFLSQPMGIRSVLRRCVFFKNFTACTRLPYVVIYYPELPMLELRHVTKRFSGIPAVDDVSFIAPAGEVTGYLGPNGSGKSTTLKMITAL